MAREEKSVSITEFAGLITNVGDFSGPDGGTTVQENLQVLSEGELRVRQGYRDVAWDN